MKIFVSYTTRDSYIDRSLLEMVSSLLSRYGPHYIDLLHNNALDKQCHVEWMLAQAQLLILIDSRSINQSEWVRWELDAAEKKHIPIIRVTASADQIETLVNLKSAVDQEFEKLTNSSAFRPHGLHRTSFPARCASKLAS